jgi:hypothetical protein
MKRTQATATITALFMCFATSNAALAEVLVQAQAQATENDCFPACAAAPSAAPNAEKVERKTEAALPTEATESPTACAKQSKAQELAQSAEKLNDRIKPVKEIIGYVRSPQGLAMKLVNDHVVKIPAWVGYAVDPVGSLKSKAMDEVRTRAKTAIGLGKPHACVSDAPVEEAPISADLLPLDTERV